MPSDPDPVPVPAIICMTSVLRSSVRFSTPASDSDASAELVGVVSSFASPLVGLILMANAASGFGASSGVSGGPGMLRVCAVGGFSGISLVGVECCSLCFGSGVDET